MAAASAAAQSTAANPKLFGTWYIYPLGNPHTDPVRHQFRHDVNTGKDQLIVTRQCPGDYHAVVARAVAPIEVSQDTIRILKSVSDNEKAQFDSTCQVSIQAAVMSYSISDDGSRLTITNPGGIPDILELGRQDSAGNAALPPNLFGTWLAPPRNEHGVDIQVRLVFYTTSEDNRTKLRQLAMCSRQDATVIAEANSEITVSKDQITILNSASNDEQQGSLVCKARINAGTLRYTMGANGATMTLSASGEAPIKLTREPEPGLN